MNQIMKCYLPTGYYYYYEESLGNGLGSVVRHHRENDLPASVFRETIIWYKNHICHRDNGPAQIFKREIDNSWYMRYYYNGKMHRDDGPSYVEVSYHPIFNAYFVDSVDEFTPKPTLIEIPVHYVRHGMNITDDVLDWLRTHNISENHNTWTDTEKMLYKLTFG